MMKFVWGEPKRLSNIDKHGLDFADILEFSWETAIIEPTYKGRFRAIGYFRDKGAIIIYANLGSEAISIISFRSASIAERKKYL